MKQTEHAYNPFRPKAVDRLTPLEMYELFADPTIADAIMDRIIHNAYILPLDSKLSMRQVMAEDTKKDLLLNEKEQ